MKRLSKETVGNIVKARFQDLNIWKDDMTFKKIVLETEDGAEFIYTAENNKETAGDEIVVLDGNSNPFLLNMSYLPDKYDMNLLKKGESLRSRSELTEFVEKNRQLLKESGK